MMIPLLTILALQASAAGVASAEAASNPAEVFREVCLDGGASFGHGRLVPVDVRDLPSSLRTGFNRFDSRSPRAQRFGAAGSGTRFFQIAATRAYLMTAAGTAGPCAVFWEGAHWREVRDALDGWIEVPEASVVRSQGADVWAETDLDGHALAVATYHGWIMMRTEALDRLKTTENVN